MLTCPHPGRQPSPSSRCLLCRLQGTACGPEPQAALMLLSEVAEALAPAAHQQLQELRQLAHELGIALQQDDLGDAAGSSEAHSSGAGSAAAGSGAAAALVQPWDLAHLQALQQLPLADDPDLALLAGQLDLQAGLAGLARLLQQLLGLQLLRAELRPQEAWGPGVTKLLLREPAAGRDVGHVYLQLSPDLGVARTAMLRWVLAGAAAVWSL
jgi:Zn-dependent oligopeptidase